MEKEEITGTMFRFQYMFRNLVQIHINGVNYLFTQKELEDARTKERLDIIRVVHSER